jgi:hypothetical protein
LPTVAWVFIGLGIALATLVVGCVAVVAATDPDEPGSGTSDHPAVEDVAISECDLATTSTELTVARGTVTNHSSKASNYIITVAFESGGGATQYDTGTAFVNRLEPGQSTSFEAVSFQSEPPPTDTRCRLSEVDRFASS